MLSPYHPVQLALPPGIWSVWFAVNYGGLSLLCSFALDTSPRDDIAWINWLLLLLAVSVSALLFYAAVYCWQDARNESVNVTSPQRMIAQLAVALYLTAALACFAVGAMTLIIPPCV